MEHKKKRKEKEKHANYFTDMISEYGSHYVRTLKGKDTDSESDFTSKY